jgi:hypothetical protein
MTMSSTPIHDYKPRPRTSRAPIPEPEGTALRVLKAQEMTAEANLRTARERLNAANAARASADQARTASPANDVLKEQARQARIAAEDAAADVEAFAGNLEQIRDRHADPRVAELCDRHAELESKLSAAVIASKADALIKRGQKIAELLVALDRDARELHAEVGGTANQLAAVERELGIDSATRTPHDYRLHRFRVAAALVDFARSKGVDRELLLAYVNP